jgi:hypothetical protein
VSEILLDTLIYNFHSVKNAPDYPEIVKLELVVSIEDVRNELNLVDSDEKN